MTATTTFSGAIPGTSAMNMIGVPNAATPVYMGPSAYLVGTAADLNLTPRFCPIRLTRTFKVIGVTCDVTALGTDATETTRLGIYSHDNVLGLPYLLIRDFGTVQTGTGGTGTKEVAAAQPLILKPDLYWICGIVTSSGPSTKRTFNGSSMLVVQRNVPTFASIAGFNGPVQADNTMNPVALSPTSTGSMVRFLLKGIAL